MHVELLVLFPYSLDVRRVCSGVSFSFQILVFCIFLSFSLYFSCWKFINFFDLSKEPVWGFIAFFLLFSAWHTSLFSFFCCSLFFFRLCVLPEQLPGTAVAESPWHCVCSFVTCCQTAPSVIQDFDACWEESNDDSKKE